MLIKKQHETRTTEREPDIFHTVSSLSDGCRLDDIATLAPHKKGYYNRYDMKWLEAQVAAGRKLKYVTFWHAYGENGGFSQWYRWEAIVSNGSGYPIIKATAFKLKNIY